MRVIGLTGGIGSGKSYIASIFETLGVPVYNADIQAKKLIQTHPDAITAIKDAFGSSSYLSDGTLNKKWIASLVFKNKEKLKVLNTIVHPLVQSDFESWCDKWRQTKTQKYVLKEAAILFETGSYKKIDATILVTSSKKIRIQRVISRDTCTVAQVEQRMNNQWDDAKKIPLADYILDNSENSSIKDEVRKLHQQLMGF